MINRSKNRTSSRHRGHCLEFLESRILLAADLAVTILKVKCPSSLVPGDKGSIKVRVSNVGNAYANGLMDVGIYASADTVFNASAVRLGSKDRISLNMAPKHSITLTLPLAFTSKILPGTYHILAGEISAIAGTDANSANNLDFTPDMRNLTWQFGNVGSRRKVVMTVLDGANPVKFALSGPGTGYIDTPAASFDQYDVVVNDSTAASKFSITTPKGQFTTLNSLNVIGTVNPASIKSIVAPSVNIESAVQVDGLVRSIAVHNIQSVAHSIIVNSKSLPVPVKSKVDITANVINGLTVNTHGVPIGTFKAADISGLDLHAPTMASLRVTSKLPGEGGLGGNLTFQSPPAGAKLNISAITVTDLTVNGNGVAVNSFKAEEVSGLMLGSPWVNTITVSSKTPGHGNFGGLIVLSGAPKTNKPSLGSIKVSGTMDGTLDLDSGAGSISAGSWTHGVLTAGGNVKSLKITGDCTANIGGVWIYSATIGGNYTGKWMAGFGKLTIGGNVSTSTFDMGPHTGGFDWNQFNSLTVNGWVTNSTISAANPVGTISVGGLNHSNILIGTGSSTFPAAQADFETNHTGTVASVIVTGMKESGQWVPSIIASNIAAWSIKTLKLALINNINDGKPFGVATTSVGSFTNRPISGATVTTKGLTTANSFTDNDFELRIL